VPAPFPRLPTQPQLVTCCCTQSVVFIYFLDSSFSCFERNILGGCRKLRSEELRSGELCSEELRSEELCSGELRSEELRSEELRSGELRSGELRNLYCSPNFLW